MMKMVAIVIICSIVLFPMAAAGQQACPCVPLTHEWIVDACESWNCAAAASILSNGDKYVLTLPTNDDHFKWVVVRRVVSGSVAASPDAPFRIETFDDVSPAVSRFNGIDQQLQPMMLSVADGKFLVITRAPSPGRSRAARH